MEPSVPPAPGQPVPPPATFHVLGRVVTRQSRQPVPELRVEAWDRDVKYDSLLGVASTAADGTFAIDFDETYYGDYGGDTRPDLYFKVFQENRLLDSTRSNVRENVPPGQVPAELEIDSTLLSPVEDTQPGASTEVALHELGASLALTVADVQQELARYPTTLGAYAVDEVELSIPVQVRVDKLGQVLTRVLPRDQPAAPETLGQLRLRLRASPDGNPIAPVVPSQPLESLGLLSRDAIGKLQANRVFSVSDLQRVAHNAVGRAALAELALGSHVDTLLARAGVLSLPAVPQQVAERLLHVGVNSPGAFIQSDPEKLANALSKQLKQTITQDDVVVWQREARNVVEVPRPTRPPVVVSEASRLRSLAREK
jgi:hypothetical protein